MARNIKNNMIQIAAATTAKPGPFVMVFLPCIFALCLALMGHLSNLLEISLCGRSQNATVRGVIDPRAAFTVEVHLGTSKSSGNAK
jgi:hypothetical protein